MGEEGNPEDDRPPLDTTALTILAGFAASLADPAFDAGSIVQPPRRPDGVFVLPYARLSNEASAFVDAIYKAGWIRPFQWAKWGHSPAGQHYFGNHAAIAEADIEDLSRLLTAAIRQDRFVTGALLEYFQEGLIAAIAARAAKLLAGTA